MTERLAVYAGTFDPLTTGHLWMIEQGSRLFDKLIVAIGVNPAKRCMFTPKERFIMLVESVGQFQNVHSEMFVDQYLIKYARVMHAQYILRGIRCESDYEYERVMRNVNGDLDAEITTVFLMPPRDIAEVSSSMVKGLIGPDGWESIVEQYVPAPVFKRLKEAHDAKPQ